MKCERWGLRLNKKRVSLGLTIILGLLVSISFYLTNENIKDRDTGEKIRDIPSLISISEAMLLSSQDIDEKIASNNISKGTEKEIIIDQDITIVENIWGKMER